MKRTLTGVITGSALLLGGVLAAPSAHAAGAQIVRSEMFLADSAIWVSPAIAWLRQEDRRIYLAAGQYDWKHRWQEYNPAGVAQHTYRITLNAGWYRWNCAVYSNTDRTLFDFFTRCSLSQEGGGTAFSPEMRIAPHGESWESSARLMRGSWYHWSSTLTQR